jgi:hypothetical protein
VEQSASGGIALTLAIVALAVGAVALLRYLLLSLLGPRK